jgi:hypothetical protein
MRARSAVVGLLAALVQVQSISAHPGAGIVVDTKGQVYFVHGIRHRILRIDGDGRLTTFAQGEDGKLLSVPHHLVIDNAGNVYCASDRDGSICKIAPDGKVGRIYPPADWYGFGFIGAGGNPFTRDAAGNLYCVHLRHPTYSQILKIGSDGRIINWAGGDWGFADGRGSQAKFGALHGAAFAWTADGSLLLTDNGTSVRKIGADGTVTTVAGGGESGYADGPAKAARFQDAMGLAVDARGTIYVADDGNRRIRTITPDGIVATFAGSGKSGGADGPAGQATFADPSGVAVGRDGIVYVLDFVGDHPRVRKIGLDRRVTTIARTE